MRLPFLFTPLAILFFAAANLHAQLVPIKDAVFTGTVSTSPASPSGKIVNTPITKATLLALSGNAFVKASDAAYFSDYGNGAIVLASKDGATVYLTITNPDDNSPDNRSVSGKLGAEGRIYTVSAFFNDVFHGSYSLVGKSVDTAKVRKQTITLKIAAGGSVGFEQSQEAVLIATFSGSIIVPLQQ